MGQVGDSAVANRANTTRGYAEGVGAENTLTDAAGQNVGAGGVVDLFNGAPPAARSFIADETDPGYVLQEDDSKIVLEAS